MTISKPQVEAILKTLPISYYCGKGIDVNLVDTDATYFDPIANKIQIGFAKIETSMKTVNDEKYLEQDIRTLLYHEVSHAILTPKSLAMTASINVFEDERIETVLADFYNNVDFKDFCIRSNNFKGEAPTSAFNFFYQIVRFRLGPKQFTDRVKQLIKKYSYLTTHSDSYSYYLEVVTLYTDICNYFKQSEAKQMSTNQTDDNDNNDNNNEEQTICIQDNQVDLLNAIKQEQEHANIDIVKTIFDTAITYYEDTDLQQHIDKLLLSAKHMTKQNASAINAYSGIFNPRSVIRDDYKYFVQKNRSGHIKQFSKIKLNLFIDCSGSFHRNDAKVNRLLHALCRLEKSNPEFEYDLIHCHYGQDLAAKNKRFQKSCGGTCLTDSIIDLFRQVQNKQSNNINIVLYDGYIFDSGRANHQLVSVFNTANTVCIFDNENAFAKSYITAGRLILTDNYVDELYKNVLNALQILL